MKAVGAADVVLSTLQDSMLPVEVGDRELRAGPRRGPRAHRAAAGARARGRADARPLTAPGSRTDSPRTATKVPWHLGPALAERWPMSTHRLTPIATSPAPAPEASRDVRERAHALVCKRQPSLLDHVAIGGVELAGASGRATRRARRPPPARSSEFGADLSRRLNVGAEQHRVPAVPRAQPASARIVAFGRETSVS